MSQNLENPNFSPTSPRSRDLCKPFPVPFCEINLGGQPVQIHTLRKSLGGIDFTATIPNGDHISDVEGTAITEQLVVNSQNLRLLSIEGTNLTKHALYYGIFEFARRNDLSVYPSEKMEEATKQWLIEYQLPDSFLNPNI